MHRQFFPVVGRGQGLTGWDGGHLGRASFSGPSALLLFLLLAQGRADWGNEASEKSARL